MVVVGVIVMAVACFWSVGYAFSKWQDRQTRQIIETFVWMLDTCDHLVASSHIAQRFKRENTPDYLLSLIEDYYRNPWWMTAVRLYDYDGVFISVFMKYCNNIPKNKSDTLTNQRAWGKFLSRSSHVHVPESFWNAIDDRSFRDFETDRVLVSGHYIDMANKAFPDLDAEWRMRWAVYHAYIEMRSMYSPEEIDAAAKRASGAENNAK